VKKAFTLIELLVVVAIIGVLTALMAPAVAASRAASSRAISAHSLHELIVAGNCYLGEHNNNFWPYQQTVPGGTQWWFGFEAAASKAMPEGQRTVDYSRGPLGPYASASGGVKTDPAFLQYSPRLKPKYSNGNYGYGYNTVLSADSTGKPRNSLQIENYSQVVVFATCAQVNTFQSPASSKNPMIEEFYMVNDTQNTVHFRHGGKALAAFLDGSVRDLDMATDMVPGSHDMRIPSANIGRLKTAYFKQSNW
jgi:prepilin-type N-terminal cleavage/methylation domain-containing protein/prepilin-type processing-associated H-X9-DG protein